VWKNEQNAESFQPPPTNDSGYFKTRWVAEMLMEEAARRGFPTTIYRCPAHTAPIGSLSATPGDNFTINLYLSMVQTGLILRTPERPDKIESDIGMVPINYLADTIVRLANTKESRAVKPEALRLHIINPNSLPYCKAPEVIAQVRDDNVPGKLLDIDEWFEAITASSNEKAYLEWATYNEYLDKGHIMFTIDDSMTRPLLKEIDSSADSRRVRCPPVDAEYLGSILKQEEMFHKNKR
jgi:thioester reductase-like protein